MILLSARSMTAAVDECSRGDNSSSGSRRRCRTGHTGLGWPAGASHSPVGVMVIMTGTERNRKKVVSAQSCQSAKNTGTF